MADYVLRIIGLVQGDETPFDGELLEEYDPNREGLAPDGSPMLAHIVTTRLLTKAMVFKDPVEAMEKWKEVSTRWPTRPDGKPNRPLTAFSVTVYKKEK